MKKSPSSPLLSATRTLELHNLVVAFLRENYRKSNTTYVYTKALWATWQSWLLKQSPVSRELGSVLNNISFGIRITKILGERASKNNGLLVRKGLAPIDAPKPEKF